MSQLSLDLGEKQIEHNEIEVNTPGDNFRRRVLMEGSDDGNTWNKLVEARPGSFSQRRESRSSTRRCPTRPADTAI